MGGRRQLREAEKLPQCFSPKLATEVTRMGGYIGHVGVSGISCCVLSPGAPTLSKATASEAIAHARACAQAVEQALGCAVGLLDIVNIRHGHRVSLFDKESRRAVQGRIPAESQEEVRSVLGRRGRAIGPVTRNGRGQVFRVAAEELERVGDAARRGSRGVAPW